MAAVTQGPRRFLSSKGLVLRLIVFALADAGIFGATSARATTNAAPAEPMEYRLDDYRAPTPATLRGGKAVSNDEAMMLWKSSRILFIDVMPRPRKPDNLPPKTLWRYPARKNIPGSIWLPNTGYGVLNAATAAYFRNHLERLTKGNRTAPVLFYCLKNCWMSWNAAKRAIELGYSNVYWYADGSDGWSEIRGELQAAQPVEPVP